MDKMEFKIPLNLISTKDFSTERKRLYSWTRPSKNLPRKVKYDSVMEISGPATLAFSPDLKWFQGNITSDSSEVYTITGRLRLDNIEEAEEAPEEGYDCSSASFSIDCQSGQKLSPTSEDEQLTPSEGDILDSEVVRRAIENLGLEEEGLEYKVSIMDYETGINHTVENVSCRLVSDVCELTNDDSLVFRSESCSKGAKADMVILTNIGQSLTDNNMVVYQGHISYTYDDMVCYPLESQSHGQWCL